MESHTFFMGWKTQHCYDTNSPEIGLYTQYNPIKFLVVFFAEIDKMILLNAKDIE